MAGSHVLIQGLNGSSPGKLPVLLIHVVGARSRVISDPDTEVLDLKGLLLEELYSNPC